MNSIEQDFFSDDREGEKTRDSASLFHAMLSLPASSSEWQTALDDLSEDMMLRLIEAYKTQQGRGGARGGAIKVLERRLAKRGKNLTPKPKEVEIPVESKPETPGIPGPDETAGESGPWFPKGWGEVRASLLESKIEPPQCYMCRDVYDALANNTGLFDDKFGEGSVCPKENVLWHWNVDFCKRKSENARFKMGA
jgi:hypothetical protein